MNGSRQLLRILNAIQNDFAILWQDQRPVLFVIHVSNMRSRELPHYSCSNIVAKKLYYATLGLVKQPSK